MIGVTGDKLKLPLPGIFKFEVIGHISLQTKLIITASSHGTNYVLSHIALKTHQGCCEFSVQIKF